MRILRVENNPAGRCCAASTCEHIVIIISNTMDGCEVTALRQQLQKQVLRLWHVIFVIDSKFQEPEAWISKLLQRKPAVVCLGEANTPYSRPSTVDPWCTSTAPPRAHCVTKCGGATMFDATCFTGRNDSALPRDCNEKTVHAFAQAAPACGRGCTMRLRRMKPYVKAWGRCFPRRCAAGWVK